MNARPGRRMLSLVALALLLPACGGGGGGEADDSALPSGDMGIMAPADPGGGWDGTARAMQTALTDGGVVDADIEVYNVGGAGGTIGLAEFVSDRSGDPLQWMVMGLVMVGAIETNDSPATLEQVTPIASLTTEWEGIVVPANSPYETFEQLLEDFRSDPRSISWGGGSAGGTDHILVGLIASEAGVDPADINYVAHAGGGEALSSILSGGVTAGVSGVSEFRDQVEGGQLRWLAVSSPEPLEGVEAPTIIDAGMEVELSNWRGVVAPGDITDEQRDAIVGLVEDMAETEEWQEALETNGWEEFLQTGDEFQSFLDSEQERVTDVLAEIGLTS